MSIANFIKNNFQGKELCVSLGESAETIIYDQSWANNREFFRGIVEDVQDEILIFNIFKYGIIYINCNQIQSFWQFPFDYHGAVETSLTRKIAGARDKGN